MSPIDRTYLGIAAVIVVAITTLLAVQGGVVPAGIIGGALVASLVVWARTSLPVPTEPNVLLPPYLLTGALLMLHIGEEYLFGFAPSIGELSGADWTVQDFIVTLVLLGPGLWILGAVAVALRHPLGGFMSWFLFIGMVVGEPAHLLFPLAAGGRYHYFPGMWTALLPMVPALWGMSVVLRDVRSHRRNPA